MVENNQQDIVYRNGFILIYNYMEFISSLLSLFWNKEEDEYITISGIQREGQRLNDEKIEAKKQNDLDSIFEIDTVLDIIKNEEEALDYNLSRRDTINDALSFWPEILLPAPSYIKLF